MPTRRKSSHTISRRTVLHGAGVTMALPWLPSLALADTASPAAPPKRFGEQHFGLLQIA